MNARASLHRRFSTNRYGWFRWVFDHFFLPPRSRILELGCGPGTLWMENRHRIPAQWDPLLSDSSWGMIQAARQQLGNLDRTFHFAVLDARWIPVGSTVFDAVIANHMLYHVSELARALAEIHRILRPGGHLYAATNGGSHLRELAEFVREFDSGLVPDWLWHERTFALENGSSELARWFPDVGLHRYEDSLIVTDAEAVVAYVFSMLKAAGASSERRAAFLRFVTDRLALGPLRVTKDTGLFIARRP